jgi:hypothetical protein
MPFLFLLFMHCLADFPLQGQWLAEQKGKEPLFMFAHCVIWTGMISLGLHIMGILSMWKIAFLFFGHFGADTLKCSRPPCKFNMYLDQLYHMFQIAVVLL